MDNNTKRLDNCDFIKTIMMLIIVLYHSVANPFSYQQKDWIYYFNEWLASFHNYTFLFVAGYVFYYLQVECGKYSEFSYFIVRKVERLIIPALFVAVCGWIPVRYFCFSDSLVDLIKRYILVLDANHLWFLWMLFWVFVIFWPLSIFFRENDILGFCVVCLLFAGGGIFGFKVTKAFQLCTGMMYLSCFWLGYKARQKWLYLFERIPIFIYLTVNVVLYAMMISIDISTPVMHALRIAINFPLHMVSAVMMFLLVFKVFGSGDYKKFSFLSRYTYGVFLFHHPIMYLIVFVMGDWISIEILMLLKFGISLCLSVVLVKIFDRYEDLQWPIGEF